MFNSGVRGRRAKDIEGIINPQTKYIQNSYPYPSITGYTIVGVDDTALNTVGGQTVIVTGTNFLTGVSATVGGAQIGAVTLLSSTQISFVVPALSAGTYPLVVYNASGGAAILVPGMVYSSFPTYLTNAGSIATVYETNPINTSVSAPSDSAVTYTLVSGSLPAGATLNSNGTITGTAPLDANGTTYTFSIKATDAELQDVTRTFTITVNTDVVTWVTPANGATITIDGLPYSQTLSATSAAGKTMSYTADTLPAGLTLSGGVISGTPTTTQTIVSVLTGTANTSTRTKTNSITWIVNIGDVFFKYTTLLLNGSTTNNLPFINDASLNNTQLNIYADAKGTTFTPFAGNYYSVYFPANGSYISGSNAIFNVSATNVTYTFECWVLPSTAGYIFAIGSGAAFGNSFTVGYSLATANKFRVLCGNGSSNPVSFESNNTYAAGIWYHVAVTRTSGGVYILYVNGLADGTQTYNAATLAAGTTFVLNGAYDNNGLGNNGGSFYISNLRFLVGTALYNGSFTSPTQPLSAIANTTLLTCQSNLFADNSPYNQSLTRNNALTVVSPANPFGSQTSVTVNTGASVYFNGTTDYMTLASNSAFAFGTGDFTIEGWYYFTGTIATYQRPWQFGDDNDNLEISSSVLRVGGATQSVLITGTTTILAGVWYHIAVTRASGTYRLWLNGTQEGSSATNSYNSSARAFALAASTGGLNPMAGYISNLRVIKGTAIYTSGFTPSTTPLTLTFPGMATTGPANALLIGAAGSGQSLSVSNGNLTVSGDFTFECWASRNGISANQCMACWSTAGDAIIRLNAGAVGSGSIGWSFGGYTYTAGANTDGNTFAAVGTWFHVAIVRIGTGTNNCSLYINGQLIQQGSSTASKTLSLIGNYNNNTNQEWNGYLSNFRLSNIGRYTTSFTPPTSPYTNDGNTLFLINNVGLYPLCDLSSYFTTITLNSTPSLVRPTTNGVQLTGTYSAVSLLTCQTTGTNDNSINTFNPTIAGQPKLITNTYPFTQSTATVSNLTTLGSAYFDGTGDYITSSTNNTKFAFGAYADFTAECWVYMTAIQSAQSPGLISVANATSSTGWQVYYDTNGWGVRSNTANVFSITGAPTVGQWYHVAYVRRAGVHSLYVNGVQRGNSSTAYTWSDNVFYSGYTPIGNNVYGYVTNIRLINGTALYTSSFLPPTTPLTAVTNTQLLTLQYNDGGNNYGIIDNSNFAYVITRNGNTTQSAFSPYSRTGWSTYFDGSSYITTSSAFSTVLPGLANNKTQIECWVFPLILATTYGYGFLGPYAAVAANGRWYFGTDPSGYLKFTYTTGTGTQNDIVTTIILVANVWQHVAVTIDATTPTNATIQMYYNGTPATVSTGNNMSTQTTNYGPPNIVVNSSFISLYTGFISNLRVLKNNFTYTGVFTPPALPFVATQDTVLLALQSNRFIDNAPNPSTLAVGSGTPAVYAFHPFGTVKEATPLGYSTYFAGGTSDFLTVNTSAGQHNLPGDFTIELWFYDMGTTKTLQQFAYSSTGGFACGINSFDGNATRKLDWRVVGSAPVYGFSAITSYRWNHAAYVKSGSTFRIYLNGLLEYYNGTYTNTFTSTVTYIGAANNADANYSFNGYISNFRVVKTAIYTSTNTTLGLSGFTVPTSQLGITQSSGTNIAALSIPTNGNSVYFNGTSDYLTVPTSVFAQLGLSDFTIESWIFFSDIVSDRTLIYWNANSTGYAAVHVRQIAGRWALWLSTSGSAWAIQQNALGPAITANTWYHVAVVRVGTSVKLYINGSDVTSGAYTVSGSLMTTYTLNQIGVYNTSSYYMSGFISNLRIVIGIGLYTGTFTVPTSPLQLTQSAGTNIVALSGIPTNGNSVYFDGTGDYLSNSTNNTPLALGSGDFTIEFWMNCPTSATAVVIYDNRLNTTSNTGGFNIYHQSGSITVYGGATTNILLVAGTISYNVWNHIAVVRSGGGTGNVKLYINGALASTYGSADTGNYVQGYLNIGCYLLGGTASNFYTGYISNFRIVKGTAVYTTIFNTPTVPLTAIAGTSLLTCQSTTFADNSTNNYTLTANGDTIVNRTWSPFGYAPQLLVGQATTLIDNSNNNFIITASGTASANKTNSPFGFSPQLLTCQSATGIIDNSNNSLAITSTTTTRVSQYNPYGFTNSNSSLYIPSIHGGGAYFDGTGDYLSIPYNSNFAFPANFTVEFWINYSAHSAYGGMVCCATSGAGWSGWNIVFSNTADNVLVEFNNVAASITSSSTLPKNCWNHVAVVRNGSTVVLYVNGVNSGSTTYSASVDSATASLVVGIDRSLVSYFTGYMSDVRITKSAVYTSNFFPPFNTLSKQITTANQSAFLLNFTNIGNNDLHGSNILESIGNTGLAAEDPLLGNYYSNYFNGTTDKLLLANSTAFNIASNLANYTIEAWVYPTVAGTVRMIVNKDWESAQYPSFGVSLHSTNVLRFDIGSGSGVATGYQQINGLNTIQTYQWTHVAVVISTNTSCAMYINGVLDSTTPITGTQGVGTSNVNIGSHGQNANWFSGFISNLRITKSIVYSGNFTPSTDILTTTSQGVTATNVALLTCQTSTFKDNSNSAYAFTKVGSALVRTFNPFKRNVGISLSFPVAGSYLFIADNQTLRLGTGDFTIECWFYMISNSTDGAQLFAFYNGTNYGMVLHTNTTAYPTKLTLWIDTYGTGPFITGTATLLAGQWNFVAITRAAGVYKLWLNGAQDGSNYTNAATPDRGAGYNLRIGGDNTTANRLLNGYLKDFRITKGYARYTTAFTNPTLPFAGL